MKTVLLAGGFGTRISEESQFKPKPMIEAMACGIPTITTRSGGIPEYVGDCAVVLERDEHLPENIAMEVDRLLNDKTAYSRHSHIKNADKMPQ